jgi:hypothetical protein
MVACRLGSPPHKFLGVWWHRKLLFVRLCKARSAVFIIFAIGVPLRGWVIEGVIRAVSEL